MSDAYVELVTRADRAQATNDLVLAERLAREALSIRPDGISARELLGILAVRQSRFETGIRYLVEAQALDPETFQAPLWLSQAYRSTDQFELALESATLAVLAEPMVPEGHHQLGLSHMALDQYKEAELCFRQASALEPANPVRQANIGHALYWQNRFEEAAEFNRLAALGDPSGKILIQICDFYLAHIDYEQALNFCRLAVESMPGSILAEILLSRSLVGLGRYEEAEQLLVRLEESHPDDPQVSAELGTLLESQGRIDVAAAKHRKAILLDPTMGICYYALVEADRSVALDVEFREQLRKEIDENLASGDRLTYLHYTLGRAHELSGEYESAMVQYDLANQTAAQSARKAFWSCEKSNEVVNKAAKAFDASFFERAKSFGSRSDRPILVVGMMRSGTTLAEQILSSHSEICGAGELPFWMLKGSSIARGAAEFDLGRLPELISSYDDLLQSVCPGARKVVDKMPGNYHLLGLIHAAFPHAKIIHLRRNPIDTCLSIWSTPKVSPTQWGYRKQAVVCEYKVYLRYMEHWRSLLPTDALLEIDYEELTSSQEDVTRRMIAFCGLEWEEACLYPEKNRRTVTTPSLAQVRRRVYNTSVARWKNFEPWLGEFMDLR
jgi:tetratricopeptide (TPR) repeat protein